MPFNKNDELRQTVHSAYADIANNSSSGCDCGCGTGNELTTEKISAALGYSNDDVKSVPEGANLGLGCGNPQAIASLNPGETVLDLGSGGGFDCFLAAKAVGEDGYVYGVDMTPEMINLARANAKKTGLKNVEFRLGEIENLPVSDNSVDVIISNCVINLSPEKPNVLKDAFRVLKKGGRLAVTDIVATTELPEYIKNDLKLYSGCVSGASQVDELYLMLENAGFEDIRIKPVNESKELIRKSVTSGKIEDYVVSASIEAVKSGPKSLNPDHFCL